MHAPFASNTNTIVEWARVLCYMNILTEGGITQFYFLQMHIYEIAVGANQWQKQTSSFPNLLYDEFGFLFLTPAQLPLSTPLAPNLSEMHPCKVKG